MQTFNSLKFLSFFVITAFLFSILEFPAIPDQEEKRGFALLEEGKNLYFAGKFEKSITKLKEAISLFEEDPSIDEELRNSKIAESYFYIGLNLLGLNERFSAKEAFKNALKYQPDLASTIQSYSPEVRELISIVKKEVEEEVGKIEQKERIEKESVPEVMEKEGKGKKKILKPLFIGIGLVAGVLVTYFVFKTIKKATEKGSIDVRSTPTGARIILDGSDTGKVTNAILTDVKVGSHTILLKKDRFDDYSATVNVLKDQTTLISATLEPGSFFENFDDGVADYFVPQKGNWYVSGGYYHYDSQRLSPNEDWPWSKYDIGDFRNFTLEVHCSQTWGDGAYGIIIRANPAITECYAFDVAPSYQEYSIWKKISDRWYAMKSWTYNGVIRYKYNEWNILKVVANGSNFTFYINNQLVASVNDGSYPAGRVAIEVADYSGFGGNILFDNISLTKSTGGSVQGEVAIPQPVSKGQLPKGLK